MIGMLVDQSRHRAARVDERHQKRTVEAAAMAFRCAIGALGNGLARVQSSGERLAIPVDVARLAMALPLRRAGVAQW